MSQLITWGADGDKEFEYGVDRGVLYPPLAAGETQAGGAGVGAPYGAGVAWNGLTAVSASPEGGEPTDLFADNGVYGVLMSPEKLNITLEHYAAPAEFYPCDGIVEQDGALITGQPRKKFGFSYRTLVGDDLDPMGGYKLHLVYGCLSKPAERAYATMTDSPEVITFSRECSTLPVGVTIGGVEKKSPELILDSTLIDPTDLAAIEAILYGTAEVVAAPDATPPVVGVPAVPGYLPTPDEILAILAA